MAPRRNLSPKPFFDKRMLLQAFEESGVKELHAVKLWGHALRRPDADVLEVQDLPKAAAQLFQGDSPKFARMTSKVVVAETSSDGLTTKLKIQLQDGLAVETVIMRWDPDVAASSHGGDDEDTASQLGSSRNPSDRATVCVSSQVGCQMGCTFCATGTMGLIGNLAAGEIVEQLVHAKQHSAKIRNVVFMGMGEPMNNWKAVTDAVRMMVDPRLFGLAPRHVTVSTVGVIPRIRSMASDLPGVSLALSLHAPNQDLRQTIVPSAKAYPIDKLMDAVAEYQESSKQKVFVEYVVLSGVNDGPDQARELGALLKGRDVTLNLIPWNPIYSPESAKMGFEAPAKWTLDEFLGIVRGSEYSVFSTVRQEKGQDISGACGQLVIQTSGDKLRPAAGPGSGCSKGMRDIEELAS